MKQVMYSMPLHLLWVGVFVLCGPDGVWASQPRGVQGRRWVASASDLCPAPSASGRRMAKQAFQAAVFEYTKTERRGRKRYDLLGVRVTGEISSKRSRWGRTLTQMVSGVTCYRETRLRAKRQYCWKQRVRFSRRKPDGLPWQPWQIVSLYSGQKLPCAGLLAGTIPPAPYLRLLQAERMYQKQVKQAIKKRTCPPSRPRYSKRFQGRILQVVRNAFAAAGRRQRKRYQVSCVGVTGRVVSRRKRRGRLLLQSLSAYNVHGVTWRGKQRCYLQPIRLQRQRFDGTRWTAWRPVNYGSGRTVSCATLSP